MAFCAMEVWESWSKFSKRTKGEVISVQALCTVWHTNNLPQLSKVQGVPACAHLGGLRRRKAFVLVRAGQKQASSFWMERCVCICTLISSDHLQTFKLLQGSTANLACSPPPPEPLSKWEPPSHTTFAPRHTPARVIYLFSPHAKASLSASSLLICSLIFSEVLLFNNWPPDNAFCVPCVHFPSPPPLLFQKKKRIWWKH